MLLAGLIHALSLKADASFPTGGSFHGWQFLGQTHHLSLANHGAPQPGADVHSRADGVLGAEGQAALADSIVALPRKFLGTQEGLAWGVQEAFSWGKKPRCSKSACLEKHANREKQLRSPFPSSKKSVMVAEVQRLQGLEASMEVRMEDMRRLSLFTPKRSSQNFESSCDKPKR